MSQRQDALDVLGPEAQSLIDELEAATTKAAPDGVVVKAEESCACEQPAEKADADAAEAEAVEVLPEPEKTLTMRELRKLLQALFETFGKSLDERMGPIEASVSKIDALEARVNALGATETEKVKAAVDSGGAWWDQLVKNSVQRRQPPVEGQGPEQTTQKPSDPFYQMFGGLKKQ